jgi:hypothetical protein
LFVSVFEGHPGTQPFVRAVTQRSPGVVVVETAIGTDTVMSDPAGGVLKVTTDAGERSLPGRFAVASVQAGKAAWIFQEPLSP